MQIEVIGLVLSLALGQTGADGPSLGAIVAPGVTFRPREREVSNWRREAATHLDASPGTVANVLLGRDSAAVTRCVRLNNYWCVKRAGWSGEIAADRDGHVAFASAAEGATVAALLLRRYYVDYGRHSAMAIVSHWAPAACGAPAIAVRRGTLAADGLAATGIGHTLRARWLAGHGRRVAGRSFTRARRSVVPDRLIGRTMPEPDIAVGLGEAPLTLSASLPLSLLGPSAAGPVRALICGGDVTRIANYAGRASAGVAASVDADLKLFDPEGRPTPRLARLMHNMSAVEIGPLGADELLIARAVAHATDVVAARTSARSTTSAAASGLGEASARRPGEAGHPDSRP